MTGKMVAKVQNVVSLKLFFGCYSCPELNEYNQGLNLGRERVIFYILT